MNKQLIDRIKIHEGFRRNPYQDTEGYLSIGFGRNLETTGISKEEAEYLLRNDILGAEEKCLRAFAFHRDLNEARQSVLIEMAFNLGIGGLLRFRNMIAALRVEDFNRAADEMLDSKWARQVGQRATLLSRIMRDGVWMR